MVMFCAYIPITLVSKFCIRIMEQLRFVHFRDCEHENRIWVELERKKERSFIMKDRNKTIEEIKASIGHVPGHLISDYNRINYNADSIAVMEAKAEAILKEYERTK